MPVEVSCPNCKCLLKAPDGLAGKKARCKRCRASFRVPGGPAVEGDDDSVSLSVSDVTPPAPAADANPFAFDDAPPAKGVDRPTPPPAAKVPALPAPGDNPFAFPGSAAPPPAAAAKPKPAEKSTSKYRAKPAAAGRPGGGFRRVLAAAGVIGLIGAAGGGAGVYLWMQSRTPPAAPANPPPADKPTAAPAAEKQAAAEKAKAAAAGVAEKAERGGQSPRADKPGVRVTGGLVLPPAPGGSGAVVQKPKDRLSLEAEAGKVRRVLFSGADAGVAAVVWPSFAGIRGVGAVDAVDRYALAGGRRIDRLEIPADGLPWPRPCDLSPDGNKFASEAPAGKLTVWDLNTKGKLLDAIDPYKADGPEGPPPGVAAVYFLGDDRLAVVSKLGAVDVWDLKSKAKAVTGTPIDGVAPDRPLADRRTVAVTPDRKAVLVMVGGTVHEIPTATGKPRAALTLPRTPDAGYALAADASGARIVAAYRATDPAPHTVLVVARLGAEKPALVSHLGEEAGVPVSADWPGPETAVVVTDTGAAVVLDAEVNRVVAAVRPTPSGVQFPGATTGLHWAVVPDPADAKKSLLVSVPLPFDGYFPLRDAAGSQPVGLALGAEGLGK